MTTDIELFLVADEPGPVAGALAAAEEFFRSVEARFSRFRPDSELAQLNGSAGRPFQVSPDLYGLVQLTLSAAEASQGLFDPTVIDALEAAGYDRSIELIREQGAQIRTPSAPMRPGRWQSILMDSQARTVTLPEGVRLDLGGIAKGWAVDRAAAMLRSLGPGLVNAGGDLQAWGDQPGADYRGQGWLAAVDHPLWPGSDVAWLWVRDGALATSSTARRRWAGGHHLIDPRTGRPVKTDLVGVTAVTPATTQAEIVAKVVLILGREAGLAWLATRPTLQALLVTAGGEVVSTPGLVGILAWTGYLGTGSRPGESKKRPQASDSSRWSGFSTPAGGLEFAGQLQGD